MRTALLGHLCSNQTSIFVGRKKATLEAVEAGARPGALGAQGPGCEGSLRFYCCSAGFSRFPVGDVALGWEQNGRWSMNQR